MINKVQNKLFFIDNIIFSFYIIFFLLNQNLFDKIIIYVKNICNKNYISNFYLKKYKFIKQSLNVIIF